VTRNSLLWRPTAALLTLTRPVRRISLVTIMAFSTLTAACGRPTIELELITPQQPIDRAIAEDIVAYIGEESGIRIRLIPPPEGRGVLDALVDGYGDIAFASNDQPFRQDVATIMPLYPTVLHIVVREDIISEDIRDMLTGRRVYAGPVGSASRLMHEKFVRDQGLGPESQTYLDSPQGTNPDIVIIYSAISPDRVPNLPDYRLLSLGTPDEIGKGSDVDRATLLNPRMRPFIIPRNTYAQATPEAVVTIAVDKLLVARSDMENTAAYDLIREILRLRPALSGNRPSLFHALGGDFDDSSFTFPMHMGARFFVDRDEPTWVERYSGVAEVAVTLFVAVVSGLFAAVNIYRIRRKNRIDVFYAEVFELREALSSPFSEAEQSETIDKIRRLQKRAFDMLVDEKLAADESFRIFLTLSNDSIRELSELTPGEASREPGD
jgi:hypothetical protein